VAMAVNLKSAVVKIYRFYAHRTIVSVGKTDMVN